MVALPRTYQTPCQVTEHQIGRKTLQRVLIARGEVSQALTAAGYFYRIIDASEAFLR